MQDVVIVAATRTAIGSFQGPGQYPRRGARRHRHPQSAEQSGVAASEVDEVIMGQVLTAGSGQNPPARLQSKPACQCKPLP